MKRLTRAVLATLLVSSMMLSLCACSNQKETDTARAFCETFCEDVKSGDADKLLTYLGETDVTSKDLKELISPSGFNSEENAFSSAVKESIRYNVQEPLYDYKAKTATVYISWGEADYNSEAAKASRTVPEFKTALTTSSETIITTSVTVDLSSETPRILNAKEVIDAVYEFNTVDHGIMPGVLSDYYKNGSLVLAPNGVYSNTEVLFASEVINLDEDSLRLDFTSDMTGETGLNEDGFLLDGKYTIFVYDEHAKEIDSFECTVKNEVIEPELIEFEDYKEDYYLSNLVYEFKDSDLMGDSVVVKSGWWDYDGTSVGKSAFASNTKVIGFSLAVSSEKEDELYYEYYYSEESDFEGINEMDPVYQGSCYPSAYDKQYCYDLDYPSTEFKPGFYGLVVYGDKAKKHIVFTAACIVVEETSDDVIGG